MDIQQKLKQFRLNQNLSLDDVAEITGISKATLWRIETGDSNPTQKTIDKINSGIAKWNVEQIIWGFKDPDDPSFDRYTADEAQDILEFNKYFLSELDLELKLSDNSVEVWAGDAGYRVSIGDLRLIKEQVVKQYAAIFNERFPLGRTEQGKTHWAETSIIRKDDKTEIRNYGNQKNEKAQVENSAKEE